MTTLDPELQEFAEFVAFASQFTEGKFAATPPPASTEDPDRIQARLDDQVADEGEVALASPDGKQAAQLLRRSQSEGAAVLADVTRRALKRWLGMGGAILGHADKLFNDAERAELREALVQVNATAELLGRSRIRLRLEQARKRADVAGFADDPTDWSAFADGEELKPLEPTKALEFFRRKITLPGITSQDLTQRQNQRAFTLAVQAEVQVLDKVRNVILDSLAGGKTVSDNTRTINKILADAGIVETVGGRPVGGAYSEMIWRTNAMESYRQGAAEELAEVADDFPVWRYVGIDDGRQRARHGVNFNLYFPSTVRFEEVRDSRAGKFDGYNCRCDSIPIFRTEWQSLRAGGARIAPGYADPLAA